MQPDTLAALSAFMETFRQLYAMIKSYEASKFKNGSNFVCEKGTFLQIRSQFISGH